jgi:hypothetical protein
MSVGGTDQMTVTLPVDPHNYLSVATNPDGTNGWANATGTGSTTQLLPQAQYQELHTTGYW